MKRKILIIVLVIILICAGTFAILYKKNAFAIKRNSQREYYKLSYYVKDIFTKECDVMFMGDSITWLYDMEENFPGKNYINRGISGDRTTDVLDRCTFTFKNVKAKKIVLLIGINDIFQTSKTEREVLDNTYAIIEKAKEYNPDAEIFVQSVYPVSNGGFGNLHDNCAGKIDTVNKELSEKAEEKGYTYIDMFSVLVDENGCFTASYTYDGLHPSKEGFKVITKELEKFL